MQMAVAKAKKMRKAAAAAAALRSQDFALDGTEYRLGKVIGTGSFATVHLAQHVPTGKTWAVKRLNRARPDQEKLVRRLLVAKL